MLARVVLKHAGMSEGMNQVTLMGNLGADPELKQTSTGSVLKFSLATTRVWLDKETNSEKKDTQWHRVVVFGRRGEALRKYLSKGARVLVQGRIHNSSYEKDGQKKYKTEIICEDLYFAGGRDRASAPSMGVGMPVSDELLAIAPTNGGYNRRPAETPIDEIAF